MGGLPGGLLTFVFTDVEGSTRLHQRLGPAFPETLQRQASVVSGAIASHGGIVLQTAGDGMFAVFSDAAAALQAAATAQLGLCAVDWPAGATVTVRMGLHTGQAQPDAAGGYTSIVVHEAARACAAAHGGQVLFTAAVLAAAGGGLAPNSAADLGAFRLRDLDDPVRLYQLVGDGLPSEFPAVRALPEAAHNVPHVFTSFVGRRRELDLATAALDRHRLVTIAGAGGVGKTRLTFELARLAADRYAGGVWLVLLANIPAGHGEDVLDALTAVVGARDAAGRSPFDALVERLVDAPIMLVLDNCEHVGEAVADIVSRLLDRCPHLHVLATSREPLRIPGEHLLRLDPFDVPPAATTDVDALSASESVQLFVQRATAADVSFRFEPATALSVAEICRRLDGVALAIELAAARVRHLPVDELLARLSDPSMLRSTERNVDSRQRTLKATIEWSYELLQPAEQALLRRLSVFRGPFTLDAVEAVCSGDGVAADEIFDLLASLVDKSLVALADTRDALRYRMLVAIAAVARAHADSLGEYDQALTRHRDYVVQALAAMSPVSVEAESSDVYKALRALESDALAVLDRCPDDDTLTAQVIATRLARLHFHRGTHRQGLSLVIRVLDRTGGAIDLRAWLRYREALFHAMLGEPDAAQEPIRDGLALASATTDVELRSCVWHVAGDIAFLLDDDAEARRCYSAARELSEDPELQHLLTIRLAELDAGRKPSTAVAAAFRDARQHFRGTGDRFNAARCGIGLGAELIRLSDSEAVTVLADAVTDAAEADSEAETALAATLLAVARDRDGDSDGAGALLAAVRRWERDTGDRIEPMLHAYPDDVAALALALHAGKVVEAPAGSTIVAAVRQVRESLRLP